MLFLEKQGASHKGRVPPPVAKNLKMDGGAVMFPQLESALVYPGPQREDGVVKVFWKLTWPLTENDGELCKYQGKNTSS